MTAQHRFKNSMTWMRSIWPLVKKRKGISIAVIIFAMIYIIALLSISVVMGSALDLALGELQANSENLLASRQHFWILIGLMGGLTIGSGICQFLFEYLTNVLTQSVVKDIRNRVFTKMSNLTIKYIDSRPHCDMLSLATVDTENVMAGLTAIFKTLIEGIFTLVFTLAFMYGLNWLLATIVLILSPLSFLIARSVATHSRKYFKSQAQLAGELAGCTLERVRNYRAVRALGIQSESYDSFAAIDQKLYVQGQKAQFFSSWTNPTTRLVNNIVYACIGIAGVVILVFQPSLAPLGAALTIGRLNTFLSFALKFAKPFNDISSVATESQNAQASLHRIDDLLSQPGESDAGSQQIAAPLDPGTIEFKHIEFGYEPEQTVLKDLNLQVFAGHRVAIVGSTGCGKTTLINLLLRFYDPRHGQILMNGQDVQNMSRSSVRSRFGMVLQDTWIFSGTVRENIAYADPDASDQEVENAAKRAQADSFIRRLPQGYSTPISQSSGLSEGEKQLISIARVLLMNPQMIILDEATSSLDAVSEKNITAAIAELSTNRTTIVIAHRLQTIIDSDAIAVLDQGRVVEIGTHDELMRKRGVYYRIYTSQYQ